MIWESLYWKKELLSLSKKINKRSKQIKWPDVSNANAEKEIMISAFVARKLFSIVKLKKDFIALEKIYTFVWHFKTLK